MHRSFRCLFVACLFPACAPAETQLHIGERVTLRFASVEEAHTVLTTRDEYIQRLSPFDRAAKIRSGGEVSEAEYLAAVSANILPWSQPEREKVTAAFELLRQSLAELHLPLPPEILLVLTNGEDEGGAPYTRGNTIVLPHPKLQRSVELISRTLCHELFHILSRNNPLLREKMYRMIGFEKCGEVSLPPELQSRKITNPDAPIVEHAVKVAVKDREVWVAPVLYSKEPRFDPAAGGNFFKYLQFRLLTINHRQGSAPQQAAVIPSQPEFFQPGQIDGFFEQIGTNTGYIIHPEEVLADNFVLLVQRQSDLPSPEVVEKLGQLLREAKAP